jgi:ribonuclease G
MISKFKRICKLIKKALSGKTATDGKNKTPKGSGNNGKGKAPKESGNNGKGKGKKPKRRSRLSNEEIEKRFPKGSEIIVQVTKGPISTKGPRVTANLSIPGRYLVMMPGEKVRGVSRKIGDAKERDRLKKILDRLLLPDDVGVIVRTVGAGASPKAFARDLRNLLESWNELKGNVKNLRTPCCVYQEPGLVERVVRDWLTEDIDSVIIDDEK